MIGGKKILSIIPARGGSKGIPLKNLRKLHGKSLLQRAIETCQAFHQIDRILVSTDHKEIAAEAQKLGLDLPFLRPEHLSGDLVGDLDVLEHGLKNAESHWKTIFDVILMIQPTSPLRESRDIQRCLEKLIDGNLDAVWTVSAVDLKFHPLKQLQFNEEKMQFYDEDGQKIIARQQLTPTYYRNGSCYAFSRNALLNLKTILPENSSAVILDRHLVSIDTESDLTLAERLLVPTTP